MELRPRHAGALRKSSSKSSADFWAAARAAPLLAQTHAHRLMFICKPHLDSHLCNTLLTARIKYAINSAFPPLMECFWMTLIFIYSIIVLFALRFRCTVSYHALTESKHCWTSSLPCWRVTFKRNEQGELVDYITETLLNK